MAFLKIQNFIDSHLIRENEVSARLRGASLELPRGQMVSPPVVGQFLAELIAITRAKRVVEVGTFTGLTALKMAEALLPDGHLTAVDLPGPWIEVARTHWAQAGVDVELKLGDATQILPNLESGIDLIFVDANKLAYPEYYETGLRRLRTGGLIVFDNAFFKGEVVDPTGPISRTLRNLLEFSRDDPRVVATPLNVGDGLLLVRKL